MEQMQKERLGQVQPHRMCLFMLMHVKGTQIYDQYQQLKELQNNHANKHYNAHVGL